MKLHHLLHERRMDRRSFSAALKELGDDLLLGFEAEVVIPETSPMFHHATANPRVKSIHPSDIDSWSEVVDAYRIYRQDTRTLDMAMDEWLTDHIDEIVNKELRRLRFDDDDEEQQWVEERSDELRSELEGDRGDTFTLFVRDRYGSFEQMIKALQLTPNWGELPDGSIALEPFSDAEIDPEPSFERLGDVLERAMGLKVGTIKTSPVKIDAKHTKGIGWVIEPDESIEHEGPFIGAEIVSPPMPFSQFMAALETTMQTIEKVGGKTNRSTGLHIGFSIPGIEQVDLLKLILFFDENTVLLRFDRRHNRFTHAHQDRLRSLARRLLDTDGPPPIQTLEALRDFFTPLLERDKYYTFNLSKLKQGYIETRMAGGVGYHHQLDELQSFVGRLATALVVARDPAAERETYVKKLLKLLERAVPRANINYDVGDKKLEAILNLDTSVQHEYDRLIDGSPNPRKQADNFLMAVETALMLRRRELQPGEKVAIRGLFKRLGIDWKTMPLVGRPT